MARALSKAPLLGSLIQIMGRLFQCVQASSEESMEDLMPLKRIRLELARTAETLNASPYCGYEFTAPLDRSGKLDLEQWMRHKDKCTVRRFWNSTTDEHGRLTHHRDNRWAFAWPGGYIEEPISRFDQHAFVEGEYVSVTEHDGVERTFRIADIRPAA